MQNLVEALTGRNVSDISGGKETAVLAPSDAGAGGPSSGGLSGSGAPFDLGGISPTMTGGSMTGGGGTEGTGRVVGTQTGQVPIQLAGGEAGPAESWGLFSDRSPIHIAPVGVNLGAILAPYQEGSPENGGYGLELMSRFIDVTAGGSSEQIAALQGKNNTLTYLMIGAGLLAALFMFWR